MIRFKNFYRNALAAGAFLFMASGAHAGYTITRTDGGNNALLVAGRDYEFVITNTDSPKKLQDVKIDLTITNYDILVAPGIQTGSNKYSLDGNGQLFFGLRVYQAGRPAPDQSGSFSMTASNSQDSNNKGTLNNVQVQNFPVTYSITPNNPVVNANVPFNINITALDGNGVVVTGYEDPVQVIDSQLGSVTFVDGSQFVNGQAQNVPVTVKAADLNNQFSLKLTLAGAQYYDATRTLAPAATKTTSLLNLIPGAFTKLIMLFPGETLSPGVGKLGTPTPQDSLVPVSLVTVQRVDQFFNPILVNPPSPINVAFDSSQEGPPPAYGGADHPPFPFTLVMTGPTLAIPSASGQVYFGGAGPRSVTATPDGDASKSDLSNITVNTGAAESYKVTVVGVPANSTITTDDVVRVEIRAFDQNGNLLTTLFGKVANAELREQLGTGEEKKEWVDTNVITDIPENDIVFGCQTCGGGGIAVMNVNLTKFGTDVKLHFVTPNRDAYSTDGSNAIVQFNVDVGAPNKVLLTTKRASNPNQGEIYSPGTYPGNSGTPPVVTAGENLIVEARITDRRFNLISGGGSSYNMTISNNLPNHYLVASNSHLSGPPYTFPNNGEIAYDPNPTFDKSFRVAFRTAGPNSLVPAPQMKVTSNLSAGAFFSSSMTVLPGSYSKLILAVPGETLRPGIDSETDGKTGTPTARQAGVGFTVTAYATDQYFNPVANPPFPNITIGITPALAGSFISGALPVQMVSGTRNFTMTLQADSNATLSDVATPSISQTVSIPVGSGLLDHFAMDTVASPQVAGVPFTATVRALDKFGNVVTSAANNVTLTPNTGATTMSPASITLTNGVFTGNLTMFAATATAKITMSDSGVPNATRDSNGFTVNVSPQGYKKLLLLLPGENLFAGTLAGKTGAPTPQKTGAVFTAIVLACDPYYNPIDTTGNVQLSSNHLAQFGSATGNFVNVNGHGQYTTTVFLKNATVHNIVVQDVNNDATVSRSTSSITGLVDGYKRLQILADGETNNPDSPLGKTGTPLAQKQAVPFNLTINAVDDNWNIVPNFNGGDTHLTASISAALFLPPNNVDSGGNNPRPFINGTVVRQAVIGDQGTVTITVGDDLNLTKPTNSVDIVINPGPTYHFQTPATATAGQAFAPVTITLEENGVPVAGYNRSIFLRPALVSGGAASGAFNPDGSAREYVMTNGAVTITDLTYAYSENIEIGLQDEFARVGFSAPINVIPSGLKYRVTVPSIPVVVGPPTTFPVLVELLDQNTNTLVKNHDHTISVQVMSAQNPTTDGTVGTTSAVLSQGVATFQETYTKAENISVKIGESPTAGDPNYTIPDSNSLNINMVADTYKKLLLLAPGETQVAGVVSPTGKTGTLAKQQKAVAFLVQVRGVDQYWNVAQDFNGGSITFESNDNPVSIGSGNPANQGSPLVNGESAANITLFNPGDTQVTVRDTANGAIAPQSDVITVGGLLYQITGLPTQVYTGTPFNMNITLFDSRTSQPVSTANQLIKIQTIIEGTGVNATGVTAVTSGQLTNGTVNVSGEQYSIAETVKFVVTDDFGNAGTSDSVIFVPRRVNYSISAPKEAIVNKPFQISVQTIDAFTGTNVKNLNRVLQLSALSALTGAPVTGSLTPPSINIVDGLGTANVIYNIAEPITIQVIDNTSPNAPVAAPTSPIFSQPDSVDVHAGPLATIDGIQDFQMQSNEEKTFTITARDVSNNPIPLQKIKFTVQSTGDFGSMAINGDTNSPSISANGNGQMNVRFTPTNDTNGRVEVLMSDDSTPNGYSTLLVITVLGVTHHPAGALDIGANRIPLNSHFPLQVTMTASPGGTIRTFYRLGSSGSFTSYDPNVGAVGFTETKTYLVQYYSEACYDIACSSPVMEFTDPNQYNNVNVTTYRLSDSIASYPNPFNPKGSDGENYVTIQYGLTEASSVEINIYDLMGQKVWHKDIDAGQQGGQAKPDNRVFWFGTNDNGMVVANGGYITTVKVGSTGQTMRTKILVVK